MDRAGRPRVIGVDFDNTIVSYDDVMHAEATARRLIPPGMRKSKQHIRDTIRQLRDGEVQWQQLQAVVYGPRMDEACLMDGAGDFFECCRRHGVRVVIVSHKSERYALDGTGTNFRRAAMDWMDRHGFFDASGFGLSRDAVRFEATRREKIQQIRALGCTHFIDDLSELFLEENFPDGVEKILFAPHGVVVPLAGVRAVSSWKEITDYVFSLDR